MIQYKSVKIEDFFWYKTDEDTDLKRRNQRAWNFNGITIIIVKTKVIEGFDPTSNKST